MADERVIQVQGRGDVEMSPDIIVINLGVMNRDSEARVAMQVASQTMHAIIAAVREQGVPDQGIQTSGLSLHPDQESKVYFVNQQISVRTENVGNAGAILDAAVAAGANASSGIQFALADPTESEDRALELAIADARRKAETVARALGVVIDGVGQVGQVTVSDGGMEYGVLRSIVRAPLRQTPIEGGQLRIVASVQVTYTFR